MTDPITIRTDHGPLSLPKGSTVNHALEALAVRHPTVSVDGVATAVNGQFVARLARQQHVLQDGDALLCFTAITGG